MNNDGIVISARRGIIWIGKYAPFFIVAIITLSNTETMYSIFTERYATFDGMVVYYKPISWWIGEIFELSIAWIFALFILSFGVEACVWNRICIVFLFLNLCQKHYFNSHCVSEDLFGVVLFVNFVVGVSLVCKGVKIFLL